MAVIHLSSHFRVLNLPMSYSVAANTPLVGDFKGNYQDDLTNRMLFRYQLRLAVTMLSPHTLANVGQWPKTQAIQKVTKVVVFAGTIIDSMRITYKVVNSATPITIQHGGPGGVQNLSFDIGGNIISLMYNFFVHSRNHSGPKSHCCLWCSASETNQVW